ncbi:Telomerase Cajal body protein 1 [Dermatophagoides farinae]|uniref:WD repeat-containing protein 79 n=1 Tax=Dermatophagoides farinae TaxID=6954 RepID=A0A922L999_DERFA|nr:telomerase cajal body protein 1-like [Dermatophagoides farinae]KAH9527304.1 Telomerase Cajal body protein 1 [Dermatophagoides farinae]
MSSFDTTPILVNKAEKNFTKSGRSFGNCLRGCKWAPDGSCICTNSDDHRIRIFNLPQKFIDNLDNIIDEPEELLSVLELKESQIIYDYCWYPYMNSLDYATCFLLCCSRDVPIHLWDAYTGRLFASYIAEDNVCELVSARSVCFMADGKKILAGYEKFICIFDLSRPGKHGNYIYDIPKGIISCLSCNDQLFATGSFNRLIGLYDIDTMEHIATLKGHHGGVTHLQLSPDNMRLYSGARKDQEILCWDLRNYGEILHIIRRDCPTNQRIYFDVNFQHNILATGDDQQVRFYNLYQQSTLDSDNKVLKPFNEFHSHNNRVNGISLHPSLPLLATTSGERCLLDFNDEEDIIFDYKKIYTYDNNMKFWWFKTSNIDDDDDKLEKK